MKKITILFLFLIHFCASAQTSTEIIQRHLDKNYAKLDITSQDINDWFIESEASSESTNINNYYVKQRNQGIEIYGAVTNFSVKNQQVINVGNRFVKNASQKANATTPSITVLDGLNFAKNQLQITNSASHEIIEQVNAKKFKISNGNVEDLITATLVYHQTEDSKLKLAWNFTIPVAGHQHLWSVRIDASNGQILDKHDMVISCNFGERAHTHTVSHNYQLDKFNQNFYKSDNAFVVNTLSGSYRVVPYNIESPNHGPRQLITSPHNVVASPYGWHDTNGAVGNEYTTTRGNNVFAQDDADGSNSTAGVSPNGGASLLFDYPYGGTTVQASTYLPAATTNLFYMNNIMHDIWYQYGFNEANGNFQQNNYGKGGPPSFLGDAVYADAQDGSTADPQNLNNANFSTPVDGTRPRMQMYLWNSAPAIFPLKINSPADMAGPRDGRDNAFTLGHVAVPIAPALVQANLVLYNDGTPDGSAPDNADACGPAVNAAAIAGKIAVIRRSLAETSGGTPCAFTEKVKNAQNAGAIAVIIVNNVEGIISMSGADATITIPAISVTQAVGEALIARIKIETVNATLQLDEPPYVNADGDFDNSIIAHEYGHGISTRLTGGPSTEGCLQNAEQMGEGWSDWIALMVMLKTGDTGTMPRTMATFAAGQPTTGPGIRTYPYSTDMSINPLTFADSNYANPQQHTRGEVMAAVMWDLTWAYITKYGYNANIYSGTGGNNKVMRLAIDAFKLQPCGPSTIDYRNAIIAADQATTGGQDYCMITEVFRRRGMGLNASSGSATNALDQVEDFTPFPAGANCTLSVNDLENNTKIKVYPNPSKGQFNISIDNFSGNVDINIYDINGRAVYSLKNASFDNQKTIQAGNLQSGLYILKISSESLNHTQKIIIN